MAFVYYFVGLVTSQKGGGEKAVMKFGGLSSLTGSPQSFTLA